MECVELLLECKANAYLASTNGQTPLHLVVEKRFAEVAQRLLEGKANS